jgi:hypothetical protein
MADVDIDRQSMNRDFRSLGIAGAGLQPNEACRDELRKWGGRVARYAHTDETTYE